MKWFMVLLAAVMASVNGSAALAADSPVVYVSHQNPARGVYFSTLTSQKKPLPVIDGDTIYLQPLPSASSTKCKSRFPGITPTARADFSDSLAVSGIRGLVEIPYQCTDAAGTLSKVSAWLNVFSPVTQNSMVVIAVENAASLQLNLLDGQPLAPYEIISIFGDGFTSDQPAQADSFPLPTSLNSVSVMVGGVPAPLLYVSQNQINAQVPAIDFSATNKFALQVLSAGKSEANSQVTVVRHESELFNFQGHPIVQFVTKGYAFPNGVPTVVPVYNLFTAVNPVTAYDENWYILVWYGTGMGAPTPPRSDALPGMAAPANPPATKFGDVKLAASIGNGQLPEGSVAFVGATPGLSGLDQVNFYIPAAQMNAAAKQKQYLGQGIVILTLFYENGAVGISPFFVRQ